jgi:Reverse transcriptase (RNA-dependent DNA polymerase)
VLHKLVDVYYMVYLDNILIFLKIEEEYAEYVKVVLYKLRVGALYTSPKKYTFFIKEVKYLGFLISKNSV